MDTELLKKQFSDELTGNILPFWISRMQDPSGGFWGRMDGKGRIHPEACKGVVLNARILWTFAAAYKVYGKQEYLCVARRAKNEIINRFMDSCNGGVYWSLDADGQPLDTKKQLYAQGFAIYSLSEYFRATGDKEALQYASRLFDDIENHFYDALGNGYAEALSRDWNPIDDMRLSDKDRNDARTMNSHLHILEPYTNLYRVLPSDRLEERIRNLIGIFTQKIIRPDGHLGLFFDENWNSRCATVSFGHDIEASWLLWEAAEVLNDKQLQEELRPVCLKIADASAQGLCRDGSLRYEACPDDWDRHWWVQAENIVGNWNAREVSSDEKYLDRSLRCWDYVRKNFMAPGGEWYWSIRTDGTANTDDDRAGFWKCPYHNSRMCLELIKRLP